jgi:Tol biopolymer transport system component
VFESTSTGLLASSVPAGSVGIYVLRIDSGERQRVDVGGGADEAPRQSATPAISADGRFVAFMTRADLTGHRIPRVADERDVNGLSDVYVRDTVEGTTTRVSRQAGGKETNGPSYHPAISADGRYVAFVSEATNLTTNRTPRVANVFVHDRASRTTELISRTGAGRAANGPSTHPAISRDGTVVAFQSIASDLVCDRTCDEGTSDINLLDDVYVHDRATGRMFHASRSDDEPESIDRSAEPAIDSTGSVVAFGSGRPAAGLAGPGVRLVVKPLPIRMSELRAR